MRNVISLLRPEQWYKNVLVFAALFFSHNLLHLPLLEEAVVGFLVLCAISAAGYCVNDVIDAKADRHHKEKRARPVASGSIPVWAALLLAAVFYALGLSVASLLGRSFFLVVLAITAVSLLYSAFLKHVMFLDILTIASLFVLRALAGVFIIGVALSPWFLLVIMFLAIFFVAAKRHGDALLVKDAALHKPVLEHYTREVVFALLNVCIAALSVLYGLYAFFASKPLLFVLLPVFLFILLRYYFLALQGHPAIRRPERFFTGDKQLTIASLVFVAGLVVVYYA